MGNGSSRGDATGRHEDLITPHVLMYQPSAGPSGSPEAPATTASRTGWPAVRLRPASRARGGGRAVPLTHGPLGESFRAQRARGRQRFAASFSAPHAAGPVSVAAPAACATRSASGPAACTGSAPGPRAGRQGQVRNGRGPRQGSSRSASYGADRRGAHDCRRRLAALAVDHPMRDRPHWRSSPLPSLPIRPSSMS